MKLIYCGSCEAVFNLTNKIKKCSCKKTSGKLVGQVAEIQGPSTVFSFGEPITDFVDAILNKDQKELNEYDEYVYVKTSVTARSLPETSRYMRRLDCEETANK